MRMSNGLKFAKELLGENKSVESLAAEIVEILRSRDEHDYCPTQKDKFILGLRYSEFYDDEPMLASIKQERYLKELGIDGCELYECEESIWRSIRNKH